MSYVPWRCFVPSFPVASFSTPPAFLSLRHSTTTLPCVRAQPQRGMEMPGWFGILGLDQSVPEDAAGVAESAGRMERLIEVKVAAGVPPQRIAFCGFSQVPAPWVWSGCAKQEGIMASRFPDYAASRKRAVWRYLF